MEPADAAVAQDGSGDARRGGPGGVRRPLQARRREPERGPASIDTGPVGSKHWRQPLMPMQPCDFAQDRALTPRQSAFLAALLTEKSIADAARTAGVSLRTAFAWLKEPAIGEGLREARREVLGAATTR